ncbi:MAG TPA: VOC family protein [Casimicrobiaceae bacterium]|nr:VOC family protein [Casimicrobiaceae bacterium]
MARVLGIGGVFFKSDDPARLRAWYARCLGVPEAGDCVAFAPSQLPDGGCTTWSACHALSEYFAPSGRAFMFNLIVDDLDAALRQVQDAGATLIGHVEEWPNGRFGWFMDPDGNKVELWQPCATPAANTRESTR